MWCFPANTRSIDDLEALARLESGLRIEATGGLSRLSGTELVDLWQKLRVKDPNQFNTSSADETAWHRLQAAASEAAQNRRAAKFHFDYLRRYSPDNEQIR